MDLLRTIKEEDVISDYSKNKSINYILRKAARTILFDKDDKIALLHVSKKNYYKLPGGGIESNESMETALHRECKEETGCDIEINEEVGIIKEYRNKISIYQESYCWVSKVIGEKRNTKFTEEEINDNFCLEWVKLEKAIGLIKNSKPTDYQGNFIVARDLIFLEKVKNK